MAKYTRHNSNYVKTNIHKTLKDGSTIFERDWTTIGGQLHFGPGKTPYYTNGNFIFTTSNIPYYQKRYKNGVLVGTWTYNDVKDATSKVNQIKDDEYTEDIRSFAYYGSCVELLRSTVEDIINTFPGNITLSNERLEVPPKTEDGEFTYKPGYIISNPFSIDLYTEVDNIEDNANELRFLTASWRNYTINGEEIENYLIEWNNNDDCKSCPQKADQYYNRVDPIVNIKINGYVLDGYLVGNDIIFCYNPQTDDNTLDIRPKQEIIDAYFESLEGFKKCLLNRKSKPLYSNVFVTPIEYNLGYVYYKRTYTWPSNDYCINISSANYDDFLNKMLNMAETYDELWTDNLWRKMTHEAIKNYDWTYTKEFEEGEEQDNIDGGERMHKVLNIIGRMFDDIKRKIDLIRQNNRVSYDGDRNIPNALLSDKLELNGWDVRSTIPTIKVNENYIDEEGNQQTIEKDVSASDLKIDDTFLENYGIKWYKTRNNNDVSFADVDIDFMRRMIMSSKYILSSKGTKSAIDMIMGIFGYGNDDYEITETYRMTEPKLYDYSEFEEEEVFGDKIVRLNAYKENAKIYLDDEVSGIPVGSFKVSSNIDDICIFTTYLIPFYNQQKIYDGYLTFQSKGGWSGYEKENNIEWTETLSYLHVVPSIEELLNVNPNTVKEGDIYYVANVDDYIEYTETDTLFSHFFILNNEFAPDVFASWEAIDMSGETYEQLPDDEKERYAKIVEKAKYLDNIVLDTFGNNPHVGYGGYDKGETFFDYLKLPFKYAIDNNYFQYEELEEAKEIRFKVSDELRTDEYVSSEYFNNVPEDVETKDYPLNTNYHISKEEYDGLKTEEEKEKYKRIENKINIFADKTKTYYINIYNYGKALSKDEYDQLSDEEKREYRKYTEYDKESADDLMKNIYYLNDKVVYLKNNIDDDNYKTYFKQVIMRYLMQVIPSTTILILQNFE